jgi:hypothetical protein
VQDFLHRPVCRLLKFLYEFASLIEFFLRENRRLNVLEDKAQRKMLEAHRESDSIGSCVSRILVNCTCY